MCMNIVNGILEDVKSCNFIVDLIPKTNKSSRPAYPMVPTGITIHNPGNAHLASQITKYVDNTENTVSWHFSIGKGIVYQELPINENAWHAGDGKEGLGNRYTIACEIEENEEATATAVKFLSELIKALEWSNDPNVFHTHKEWSKKNCPRYLLGKWDQFVNDIINYEKHWAQDNFDFYNEHIGTMLDTDLNSVITAGRYVTLRVSEYKKLHGLD